MCQCYQQQDQGHRHCHKACIGILTLGVILPAQLYITGIALREAAYSSMVTMVVQGGLGVILFLIGILLLSKIMCHHKGSCGNSCSCEDKCQSSCK